MTKNRRTPLIIATAAVMLMLAAGLFALPFYYYALTRLVVFIVGAYWAYNFLVRKQQTKALWTFVIMAIFQPFFRIPVGRAVWIPLFGLLALFIFYCLWKGKLKQFESK